MSRQTRTRPVGTMVLSVLLAALVIGPAAVAGHGTLAPAALQPERSADVAPALGADGTFRGAPGVAGTVDTSAWTLVSDLAAGQPPRLAPAARGASRTPAGGFWSALGSNGAGNGALTGAVVFALAVSGSDLYVGGLFTNAAGIPTADYVATWDGSAWSALGSNGAGNGALNDIVYALAVSGSDLYVGGLFTNAASVPTADYIARWDGSAWSALGSNGSGNGAIPAFVLAVAVSGSDIYVGGGFLDVQGNPVADYVVRWDGSAWSALGSNGAGNGALNTFVYALALSGSDLYVGGSFTNAASVPTADYIAKWDGSAWSALGSNGSGNGAIPLYVWAVAVSGGDVYVGGEFEDVQGNPEADHVVKWDGTAWSALGSNGSGNGALDFAANALAISGSDLYVGGYFTNAASVPTADHIAKWDGSTWSAVGSNGAGDGALNNFTDALAISGADLYAGGGFFNAAGIAAADFVAKWTIDTVAPATTITAGPSGSVASTSAIFSFSASQAGSTFQCSLDASAFSACSSPKAYSSLALGAHTFKVRATDLAGNTDATPASRAWTVTPVRKPDGRIRLGTSGPYLGGNVYNTTAIGQKKAGSAAPGLTITFEISVQNDGTGADRFRLTATGATVTGYKVRYLDGTLDVTAGVVAGTYTTATLAAGASHSITLKVKVKPSAVVGSRVKRLVTITSVGDPTRKDAVKAIGKRL